MYYVPVILINIIVILISFFLLFLYIKSKAFNEYSCYNVMILSFIILFDNFIRLIPTSSFPKFFQFIQAFLLVYLDKLLLSTIVSQVFIYYLGLKKTEFYFKYEKIIFFLILIITNSIDLIISLYFVIAFNITKNENKDQNGSITEEGNPYYYCKSNNEKIIIDTIFDSILLIFNTFCIVKSLVYLLHKNKNTGDNVGKIEDMNYGQYLTKIILMLIFNSLTFIVSYLIIYDCIKKDFIDIIYLSICVGLDLCYSINNITKRETLKIFCYNIYKKKYLNYTVRTSTDTNEDFIEEKECDDDNYDNNN